MGRERGRITTGIGDDGNRPKVREITCSVIDRARAAGSLAAAGITVQDSCGVTISTGNVREILNRDGCRCGQAIRAAVQLNSMCSRVVPSRGREVSLMQYGAA